MGAGHSQHPVIPMLGFEILTLLLPSPTSSFPLHQPSPVLPPHTECTHPVLNHGPPPGNTEGGITLYVHSSRGSPLAPILPPSCLQISLPESSHLPLCCSSPPSSQTWDSSQTRLQAIWEQMFPLPQISYIHLHLLSSVLGGLFNK